MDAKVLAAAEEKILDAWKEENPGFIRDGIVDQKAYLQAKYKILFLLKEPNDDSGKDWNMRDYLLGDIQTNTYNRTVLNITRWADGLLHLDQDIPWEELDNTEIVKDKKNTILKQVAWANIKKVPGCAVANDKEILASAKKNSALLRAQVELENPDIVVCCGTYPYYLGYITTKDLQRQKTTNGIVYWIDGKRIVIDYYHPGAYIDKKWLYDTLIGAVREIMHVKP